MPRPHTSIRMYGDPVRHNPAPQHPSSGTPPASALSYSNFPERIPASLQSHLHAVRHHRIRRHGPVFRNPPPNQLPLIVLHPHRIHLSHLLKNNSLKSRAQPFLNEIVMENLTSFRLLSPPLPCATASSKHTRRSTTPSPRSRHIPSSSYN